MILQGHANVLHIRDSFEGPEQYLPPNDGAGLSHTRVLVWLPPPQGTEQLFQVLHSPQFPLTKFKFC